MPGAERPWNTPGTLDLHAPVGVPPGRSRRSAVTRPADHPGHPALNVSRTDVHSLEGGVWRDELAVRRAAARNALTAGAAQAWRGENEKLVHAKWGGRRWRSPAMEHNGLSEKFGDREGFSKVKVLFPGLKCRWRRRWRCRWRCRVKQEWWRCGAWLRSSFRDVNRPPRDKPPVRNQWTALRGVKALAAGARTSTNS